MGNSRSTQRPVVFAEDTDFYIDYNGYELLPGITGHYTAFKIVIRYQRYTWEIKRRFREIEKLDQALLRSFPFLQNSWKPPKYFFSLQEAQIQERGLDICRYINSVVNNRSLPVFSHNHLKIFLEVCCALL